MTEKRFVCPHWQSLSEERFNLLFTKASLTRRSDEEMFHYTHTPILVEDELGTTWRENQILDLFTQASPRKVVIVVQGNTGTGKSELCVYLSLELEKKGRKVLHVDKNSSLMDILRIDIPQFFKEVTGREFPGIEQIEQLYNDLTNSPELVAKRASSGVILRLLKGLETRYDAEENKAIQKKLEELITRKLRILIHKGENPIDMIFITKEDLETRGFDGLMRILPGGDPNIAATETNRMLWEIIRLDYSVPTLDQALAEVTKATGELRPIIVFEDFSIAGLDLERLSKYMESDKRDNLCDFIIAGLHEKVPPRSGTRVERFRYFTTTTSDQKEVLFLNESTCVEFIEPFLSFPKSLDGSLKHESTENSKCAHCGKCDNQARTIIPFNRVFLKRLFSSLNVEQRTPRLFVSRIRAILSDYRNNGHPPSDSQAMSKMVPPVLVDEESITDPTTRRFAAWYGTQKGNVIEVDLSTAELFGIRVSEFEANGIVTFPTFDPSSSIVVGEETRDDDEETERDEETEDKERKRILGQYNIWKKDPNADQAKEFRTYLNLGLRKLMVSATSGYRLTPGSSIHLALGQNEYPFHIDRLSPALGIPQGVDIPPGFFLQKGATLLAIMGMMTSTKRVGEVIFKETLEANAHIVGMTVYKLRFNTMKTLRNSQWSKWNVKYSLYEIVVACVRILMAFQNPFSDTAARDIVQWLFSDFDQPSFEHLDQLNLTPRQKLKEILTSARNLRKIAVDLFGLTSKSLNIEKIRSGTKSNPITIVRSISGNCPHRRLSVGDIPVIEILKPYRAMPKITDEIFNLISSRPTSQISDFLSMSQDLSELVKGISPKSLKTRIDSLKKTSLTNPKIIEQLEEIEQFTDTDFQEYRTKIAGLRINEDWHEGHWQNLLLSLKILELANYRATTLLIDIIRNLNQEKTLLEEEPLKNLLSILRRL